MAEPTEVSNSEIKLRSWPSPQDYNEAIQNLSDNARDSVLSSGRVELNSLGLPRPLTGAFASVYRVVHEKRGDIAVRCFLRDISDQQERYAHISRFVQADDLPYTVTFDFLAQGLRVGARWYPALKMDWVSGDNLDAFVVKHLADRARLEKLADSFKIMCKELQRAGIAHGDLQHGNILVCDDDELRLVDYDAMFVPGMEGMSSNEVGHRNYQHPVRSGTDFGASLDNFSAWCIYAALRAVAIDPSLWTTLSGGDDCLLLRQDDLRYPESSYAFSVLENHPNEEIKSLARFVRSLCHGEPMGAPGLCDHVPVVADELPPLQTVTAKPPTFVLSIAAPAAKFLQASGLPAWLVDSTRNKTPSGSGAAALARSRAPFSASTSSPNFSAANALVANPDLNQPLPRYIVLDKTGGFGSYLDPVTAHLLHLVNPAFWFMFLPLIYSGPPIPMIALICLTFNVLFELCYWVPRIRDRYFAEHGIAAMARTISVNKDVLPGQLQAERYWVEYEYDVQPSPNRPQRNSVRVKKEVNAETYALFKNFRYTVVLYHVDHPSQHVIYHRSMFKAIAPIIPTGVEPELLPHRRETVMIKDVEPARVFGMMILAVATMVLTLKGLWLIPFAFAFLSYLIFHHVSTEAHLARSGIPARATIRSITTPLGSDHAKIEYEFRSHTGPVRQSIKLPKSQAKQFKVGQIQTVLYEPEHPGRNVLYALSHYKVL